MTSVIQIFTDGVRDSELQQVLRMTKHKNIAEALVHALQFEDASGWLNHKVRILEDSDSADN